MSSESDANSQKIQDNSVVPIVSEKFTLTQTEVRLLKFKHVPTPQNPKPSETRAVRKQIAELLFMNAGKANYYHHSQEPFEHNIL